MVNQAATGAITKARVRLTPWTLAAIALALVFLAPILAVFAAATGDSGGLWDHLFRTVFPRYVANTLTLMAGVGCVSLLFGVTTAWVVHRYRFPGKAILEWMLILPLAVPTYLIAYPLTYQLTYLIAQSLTYPLTYLTAQPLTYLLTYLIAYPLTYLIAQPLTYSLPYLIL